MKISKRIFFIFIILSIAGCFSNGEGVITESLGKETFVPLTPLEREEVLRYVGDFRGGSPAEVQAGRTARYCGNEKMKFISESLTWNDTLAYAAQEYAAEMYKGDFFGHVGADGGGPGDRIAAAGYLAARWGENLSWGYSAETKSLEKLFFGGSTYEVPNPGDGKTFASSESHCRIAMRPYPEVGIGRYGDKMVFLYGIPQ